MLLQENPDTVAWIRFDEPSIISYPVVKSADNKEYLEIQDSRRLDALSKITTYMREHYKEDLRLSGLAAMFGYSDAYLSRMFRKYAKVNFKTYLQDIRMAYAYKELLHTDHTISSIALDNGFASSRAFSREFVKRYGILPGRVERQNHKNVKKVL